MKIGSNIGERILDVGCGSSKIHGAIGIDQFPFKGVDIVHDLNSMPWPIKANSFDRIIFSHSISHLADLPSAFIECHRLLNQGGLVEIIAPHFASDNFNTDPTHKVHLGVRSMHYFSSNVDFGYKYIANDKSFDLLKSHISFREAASSWREVPKFNPFAKFGLEWIVNKYARIYERFFCWLLPPSEVYFLLRKLDPPLLDGEQQQ